MSTSRPSTPEVDLAKFTQMKKQMLELMHMVQQQVIGGGKNSSDHSQGGP